MTHVQSVNSTQGVTLPPSIDGTLAAALRRNLRAEMARRDIPQSRAAAALGMTQQAFSRRMRGAVAFDVDELEHLAGLLGLDARELLSGSAS